MLASCECDKYTKIAEFKLRNTYKIVIYGKSCYEAARTIYYEIKDGEKILIPIATIGYSRPSPETGLQFELLTAKNGNLVAITEKLNPDIIYCIYDFTSNEGWPKPNDIEKGKELLEILKKAYNNNNFILRIYVKGNCKANIK